MSHHDDHDEKLVDREVLESVDNSHQKETVGLRASDAQTNSDPLDNTQTQSKSKYEAPHVNLDTASVSAQTETTIGVGKSVQDKVGYNNSNDSQSVSSSDINTLHKKLDRLKTDLAAQAEALDNTSVDEPQVFGDQPLPGVEHFSAGHPGTNVENTEHISRMKAIEESFKQNLIAREDSLMKALASEWKIRDDQREAQVFIC